VRALQDLPEINPMDPAFAARRLASLEEARAEHGWAARSFRGLEVLTYEGCSQAYRNEALVTGVPLILQMIGVNIQEMAGPGRSLTESEDADHSALRGVVSRWFTPRTVAELRADVEELTGKLAAPLTAAREGDLAELVTRRVPGPVFCWMMGLPEEEGDHLFDLSAILLKAFSGDPALAEQLTETSAEMRDFVNGLVDRKRAEPGNDLASIMIAAADRGEIEEDDVRSLAFELLTASTDNTHNSAALMFHLLASNPDQWALVTDGTADLADVVEECLRFDPTVVEDVKLASRDTTLLDVEVPTGTMVWASTLAAHYDPDVYPEPHRFDVTRKHAQPQLNFGIGRHYCTGAALARMELAAMLAVAAASWESIELAGEPEIDRTFGAKIATLPVRVTARAGNGAST